MSFFFCPPSISCISKGVSTVLPRACWAAYSSWYYMDSYFIKVLSLNHPGYWSATIWRYTGLLYMYLLSWREWVPGGMDAEDIPTTENSQTGVYGGGWLEVTTVYCTKKVRSLVIVMLFPWKIFVLSLWVVDGTETKTQRKVTDVVL